MVISLASCSTMKIVDPNAAANAGAAAVQALTISDAQIAQLCSQYMVEAVLKYGNEVVSSYSAYQSLIADSLFDSCEVIAYNDISGVSAYLLIY